jgi:hypothetical protein
MMETGLERYDIAGCGNRRRAKIQGIQGTFRS